MQFSATAGYGGRTTAPSAELRVFLDGELKSHGRLGRHDILPIQFDISAGSRFLTFVSTDGGNGYGHDQISLGDPRLAPRVPVEQPADSHQRLKSLLIETNASKKSWQPLVSRRSITESSHHSRLQYISLRAAIQSRRKKRFLPAPSGSGSRVRSLEVGRLRMPTGDSRSPAGSLLRTIP